MWGKSASASKHAERGAKRKRKIRIRKMIKSKCKRKIRMVTSFPGSAWERGNRRYAGSAAE
jgi:hypothetical protein